MGKHTIQYLISWDMIISQVATQVIAPFFKQQLTIEISLAYHVASPFPFWLYLSSVMHQLKVPFFALTAIYIILSKIFQSREFPQTFGVTLAYTLLKLDCHTCCNIFFFAYRCISLACEQQTHFQSRSDDRKCVCYSPATFSSSLLSERERLFLETRLLAIYHQIEGLFPTSSKQGKCRLVVKNHLVDWDQTETAQYFE